LRLQKLQLRGFKTFADRTELEFLPGVTAIVGPNGTGKSNLTDAMLWALGEQSARAVRSQKWEDIIFSGSDSRSGLGMAEVSLTVDNSDGALPIDFSEVVIARRLFRSGQSEYLLNGSPVRLRDVQDLLVDTGLTPDGYSVVGQGEIDAILSAHAEDRRELIEQVAGVRKYQIRRAEAERRLERTQANLSRVKDIVYELKRQREPLEKQAEVARQYRGLAEQLKRLELSLLALDWDRRQEKRGQALNEMENLKLTVEAHRARLREIELERERLEEQREEVGQQLDQTRERLAVAERQWERTRQALVLSAQQEQALAGRRERLLPALEQLAQRRAELQEQMEGLTARAEELEAEIARREPEALAAWEAAQAEDTRQAELQRQVATATAQVADTRRELALAQREFEAMESLQADLEVRIERLVEQQERLELRRGELQEQMETLREQARVAAQRGAEGRALWQEAQQAQAAARHGLREHRLKKGFLASHLAAQESRATVLRELAETQEGFAEGPRLVMKAAKEGRLQGIVGLVGEMLEVPRRLEAAVEAGLGPRLQWVLTQDADSAQAAADFLGSSQAGRVTFLPIDKVLSSMRGLDTAAIPRGQGVEGGLKDLLRYPKRLSHVFEVLLEDVLVVQDLEAARPARSRLRGAARLVTLHGEVLGPFGELTVGVGDSGVQAGFARKRELQEVEAALETLRRSLAEMWEAEEQMEARQGQAAERAVAVEAEANAAEREAEAREIEMRQIADGLRAALAAAEETAHEVEMLRERRQGTAEQAGLAQLSAQRLSHVLEGATAAQQELEGARLQPERLIDLRAAANQAQVALAETREQLRSLSSLRQQAQAELVRLTEDEQRRQAELADLEQQLAGLPEATAQQEADQCGQAAEVETLKTQAAEWSARLAELRQVSGELERSRREVEALGEQQREELYRAELALTRAEASMENLEAQLREVYSLSVEEARAARPEDFNEPQARREANVLRTEIRALGPVNLSSIDEVERLGAREQYLSGQAADLEAARTGLQEVIAEVDAAATQAFLAAFTQVAEAFQELFLHFFPGGETQLVLTAPDTPLLSGVDVLVRLPGKRRQNLLLLSGGERAMTAIALLFAMLKVRPTPFCVMDEIDAAIDAANTEKLVGIIEQFAERTQFIIITHNPRTMEAAGVLYGVTMRQGGVSRLISVTLEQAKLTAKEQAQAGGGASSRVLPVM
jgi:chromosome segregation protein